MLLPNVTVGKRLQVGIGKPKALGIGLVEIRGSSFLASPVIIGDPDQFPNVEAPLMVGPIINADSSIPWVCKDSKYKFIDKWEIAPCGATGKGSIKGKELYNSYTIVVKKGDHKTDSTKCKPGGAAGEQTKGTKTTEGKSCALFYGDVDIKGHLRIYDPDRDNSLTVVGNADFDKDIIIKENVLIGKDIKIANNLCADKNGFFGGTLDGTPTGKLLDRILLADARPKPFDMVHPSLGEGNRLRYACIEGPEVGVYFRGRVKNKTEIELPWYWKDLVHTESITVQLQPIGSHQNVIVKRWDSEKIYLQTNGGMPIDCFYHVYAERKDVNALVVEYKGDKHTDYPDTNYDDPQFANVINTRTL